MQADRQPGLGPYGHGTRPSPLMTMPDSESDLPSVSPGRSNLRRLVRHPEASRHQQHVSQTQPARNDPQPPRPKPPAAPPQPSMARETHSPAEPAPTRPQLGSSEQHVDEHHEPSHHPSFAFWNGGRNVTSAPDGQVVDPPRTTGTSQSWGPGTPQRLPSDYPVPQRPSSSSRAGLPQNR